VPATTASVAGIKRKREGEAAAGGARHSHGFAHARGHTHGGHKQAHGGASKQQQQDAVVRLGGGVAIKKARLDSYGLTS